MILKPFLREMRLILSANRFFAKCGRCSRNYSIYATIPFWEVMKMMKNWLIALVAVFSLAACNEEEEQQKDPAAVVDEGVIGFEMANGNVEEAQGVPAQEKEAIIVAFNQYIEAFNAHDIEQYIATLSDKKGLNLDEEREAVATAFASYDVERKAEDVTIIKYSEAEANVFATLNIDLVEKDTGAELSSVGRQVTVFAKEEDGWKVASVYYIGNE